MRQESNHRMNSGDKGSPRISNSRAMGVIILIVLLFVFQVTAFVVQKVRIAALERDAVAVDSEAAVPVRAAAAESGADDTLSGLDSRSGALLKYGKMAKADRFPFDPNDISLDSLQLLGFSRKQAQTILNYRNKGGKFCQKKDFAKMYVVDSAMYTSLAPYILLPDKYSTPNKNLVPKSTISGAKLADDESLVPKSTNFGTKLSEEDGFVQKSANSCTKSEDIGKIVQKSENYSTNSAENERFVQKNAESGTKSGKAGERRRRDSLYGQKTERNRYMCNLNTADSAALVRLYGIGGYYARKILQYRERLGGSFVSPRQLLEIDGFTQERYSKIEKSIFVREEDIRGFSILKANKAALERHPYIGPYAARGIVTYLRVKGGADKHVQAEDSKAVPYSERASVHPAVTSGAVGGVSGTGATELDLLKELVKERILTPENARKLEEYLLYL